jgi:hypothetical protein
MSKHDPKYRCLVCKAVIRRPGKHSNHRHPEAVSFEKVER